MQSKLPKIDHSLNKLSEAPNLRPKETGKTKFQQFNLRSGFQFVKKNQFEKSKCWGLDIFRAIEC